MADIPAVEPQWTEADPESLVSGDPQRLEELKALGQGEYFTYLKGSRYMAGAPDLRTLQEIHTAFLGRTNSHVARMMIGLPNLPVEERRIRGRAINLVKKWLSEIHEARRRALEAAAESGFSTDVTLPGQQRPWVGHRH